MRRRILRALAALAVVALPLQPAAQVVPTDEAPRISLEEFKVLHTAGTVVVLDSRTPEAYAQGHIPGALLLPLEGLEIWPREYEENAVRLQAEKKTIVTYCA